MSADCCVDFDEDGNPDFTCSGHKEEPDCFSCNDGGCPACERHPDGCDCANCFDGIVATFHFLKDLDEGLIYAGPFSDEPPF